MASKKPFNIRLSKWSQSAKKHQPSTTEPGNLEEKRLLVLADHGDRYRVVLSTRLLYVPASGAFCCNDPKSVVAATLMAE